MLNVKKYPIALTIIAYSFCLVSNTYAATCDGVETNLIGCPNDGNAIGHLISMVLNVMAIGMGVAATIGMIIVGTKYMMSRDSEDQVRLAKKRFAEIVIGLALWSIFFVGIQVIIPGGILNPDELGISANPNKTNNGGGGRNNNTPQNDNTKPEQTISYPKKQDLMSYKHSNGETYEYWLNIPEGAKNNMPLVIFLHGDGEAGKPAVVKNTPQVQAMMKNSNFISIAPIGHGDKSTDWTIGAVPDIVKSIIGQTAKDYQIDPKRIYLFGFSRGTIGAWNLVDKNPNYFAAAVMVSCPPVGVNPKNFISTPIRAYSGTVGQESGYIRSMGEFVKQINDLGGNATYSNTEYTGLDHNQMSSALKYDQIFSWMLSQRRK